MTIEEAIKSLTAYALDKKLIGKEDEIYCVNALLSLLKIDDYKEPEGDFSGAELFPALETVTDYAVAHGLAKGESVTARDLFDTAVMGVFTDRPSSVASRFSSLYAEDPEKATNWFYTFSKDVNYIRTDRVSKDLKWKTPTKYGDLDITINLSKPEKDPKDIAEAKLAPQSSYPKCQLCRENIGYAGRINHPARQNLRAIPVTVNGSDWMLQYSPYV